ncbi:hypothetical protein Tco_0264373 [Tanacetum coccineum]
MEDILKRRHVVLIELEDEEPEDQRRIIQDIDDDPLVSSVRESMKEKSTNFVTPIKPSGEAQEEEISPTTLEAAKTLSKVAQEKNMKEFSCVIRQKKFGKLSHQGNSQVKDNKIDLLVQQYEQFIISEDESIDSAFARFNTIITSLKALDDVLFSDPNHLIGECPKPPRDKNQRAFVGGSWSDSGEENDEKIQDETCLVAQAPNEVCSESSYFSDENSSIDDLALDNEYDKLCKMSLKIITKNKRLKAIRNSLENGT